MLKVSQDQCHIQSVRQEFPTASSSALKVQTIEPCCGNVWPSLRQQSKNDEIQASAVMTTLILWASNTINHF